MRSIATAGNTVVPALLALEYLGFVVERVRVGDVHQFRASRGDESYLAEHPEAVLGLVKLVETRGWNWTAEDGEIDETVEKYELG